MIVFARGDCTYFGYVKGVQNAVHSDPTPFHSTRLDSI